MVAWERIHAGLAEDIAYERDAAALTKPSTPAVDLW
jgi:hypothetical protein